MPSFVVCDNKAQIKGEEPGTAAEANASGKWTVRTNQQSVTVKTPTNYVSEVTGLPPGETQFTWELTRWTCKASKDLFVYYNKVVSDAGNDIYTCEDEATLHAVEPQSPSQGYWKVTEGSASGTSFVDKDKFDTHVSGLQQGDNPLVWVVTNPMPPLQPKLDDNGDPVLDANGNPVMESSGKIDGRAYQLSQSCPKEDEMIVHDLRPDEAVIQTGTKVPSP